MTSTKTKHRTKNVVGKKKSRKKISRVVQKTRKNKAKVIKKGKQSRKNKQNGGMDRERESVHELPPLTNEVYLKVFYNNKEKENEFLTDFYKWCQIEEKQYIVYKQSKIAYDSLINIENFFEKTKQYIEKHTSLKFADIDEEANIKEEIRKQLGENPSLENIQEIIKFGEGIEDDWNTFLQTIEAPNFEANLKSLDEFLKSHRIINAEIFSILRHLRFIKNEINIGSYEMPNSSTKYLMNAIQQTLITNIDNNILQGETLVQFCYDIRLISDDIEKFKREFFSYVRNFAIAKDGANACRTRMDENFDISMEVALGTLKRIKKLEEENKNPHIQPHLSDYVTDIELAIEHLKIAIKERDLWKSEAIQQFITYLDSNAKRIMNYKSKRNT